MKKKRLKIGVAGAGYVGLANALLPSQNYDVVVFDIDEKKSCSHERWKVSD